MLTGEIRSQIDAIWNAFWSGGISNPLEVIEQITYLLFIRRLDELQLNEESKAARLGTPVARRIFPAGNDAHPLRPRPYDDYRWSRFRNLEAKEMYELVSERVFPFLRAMGGEGSTYSHHMKDARFTIPTPALLAKVVDMLDKVPMEERDTKGDLYEYMLGKIATAGQNGQFRTPRHIIRLMVELVAPAPADVVCDPACGTAGYLVAVGEYLRDNHPELFRDTKKRRHFHEGLFHGFDFDNTMLRIGSMNMLLHGVESPDITYRDSLSQDHAGEEEKYTLVLANPPFAGSLDYEGAAKDLLAIVKTKKTELLFLALFLRLLKPGGRAAVIVPEGVLFGSSKAHKELRRLLVEDQKLDAVISLPSGVFKPYAGVSTAILLFTKTNSGGTDTVWFYDVDADGWSLDDKRTPLLPEEKLGAIPRTPLTAEEHARNNLPDVRALARARRSGARTRPHRAELRRTESGHRRAGLRPVDQSVQGSGARGDRPPPAERDPRRAGEDRGGDSAGDAGVGGDAAVKAGAQVPLGELIAPRLGSVDPSKYRNECFDLYSIPAFDSGEPEVVRGIEIGSAKQLVQPDDVLLSRIVPHIRRAWVVGFDRGRRLLASGEWIVFRSDRFNSRFLRHLLMSNAFHAEFMRTVSGVGGSLLRARPAHVANILVELPPIGEQRRIADILDKADALRAKRRAALAILDGLTQSIFLDMFGDRTTILKRWTVRELGNHLTFLTSGSRGWADYYSDEGDVFLRIQNVRRDELLIDDIARVKAPQTAEAMRTRVKPGDVLLSITADLGRTAVVPQDFPPAFINQHLAILRLTGIEPRFVSAFLSSPAGRLQVQARNRQAVKAGLNFDDIRSFSIPAPPLDAQRAFARAASSIDDLKITTRRSQETSAKLFASLQHRAFRGEL